MSPSSISSCSPVLEMMQAKMCCYFFTHRFRAVARVDSCSIKQESDALRRFALALTEGIHKLAKLSGTFNFKEDFVVIVCDFDVEMFRFWLIALI